MDSIKEQLPKVLIVDLSSGYGGSTSRVLSLLQQSYPEMIGLASLEGASITKKARGLGLHPHIVGWNKLDPGILFHLSRLIRRDGYDVLDTQNIQSKFWGNLAAALTGASLVSTIHSWYIDEHGQDTIKGRLYSWLEAFTNRRLDLYITVSDKDRRSLLTAHVPMEKISLIYNAVDIDPSGIKSRPEWLRERFGLPQDAVVCTAAGRLVAAKNYHTLLAAIKKAVLEVPELALVILGEGKLRTDLEKKIHALGLENHVHLPGYLERQDVLGIMKSSDVFVMSSRYEGTPIALLEAAALGCPILATRTGGIPELLRDQEHALLVDPMDVVGMAAALVKLSCDHNFAVSLGARAQRHVLQNFSAEKQLGDTWQAYQIARHAHRNHAMRG